MSESLIQQHKISQSFHVSLRNEGACIFVTGGTGLVGSHLIAELIKQGRHVRALYRSNIPDIRGKEKVEWVKGDILDIISLEEAMQNVEQVYHCAAIVSFDPKQKHKMFATNIEGTANVVNTSIKAGVEKFCYVSSVSALGQRRKGGEIDESMNWNEETSGSNYGRSKYFAEMEVWRGIGEGLKAVIVNPVIILGAGNWNEGSSKIFKTAFEEFPYYTDGGSGFVDIKDVVSIMTQLMESDISGERFIISSENRKYKDIFTAIANAFGKKPPHRKVSSFAAELVWRFFVLKSIFTNQSSLLTRETACSAQATVKYNNNKIRNFLPSFTYTSLDETIKRVCRELQQQQQL
ncbi:MAG TPA: NAD-dependent epimerase/dehydratase family protein [Segetibacter sp.]|nr:NAD-dependent epimerase/dehydratase family protein [Segetibacter sp.]